MSEEYNLFTVKWRLIDPVCIQTDHFVSVQGRVRQLKPGIIAFPAVWDDEGFNLEQRTAPGIRIKQKYLPPNETKCPASFSDLSQIPSTPLLPSSGIPYTLRSLPTSSLLLSITRIHFIARPSVFFTTTSGFHPSILSLLPFLILFLFLHLFVSIYFFILFYTLLLQKAGREIRGVSQK